ncbi:MAG: Do family serine endopeptidase [Planctomycetota bacterium]
MRTARWFSRLAAALTVSLGLPVATAQLGHFVEDEIPLEELRYARNLSNAFKSAVERVEPAVVHITTQRRVQRVARDMRGRRVRTGDSMLQEAGLGSGVIVDESGVVLTNHHVIDGADVLIVRLPDEREFEAELVGSDPATDVAVLRIDAPDLVAAPLGDSDRVGVGEWVLAIGSPFGFDRTVTAGIVSAKGRSGIGGGDDGADRFQDFLQTDASINPGNSGGPLITLDGAVVGINTAIISRSGSSAGIGFAIPANMARSIAELLLQTGRVERGWLGVGLADLDPNEAREMNLPAEAARGVLVTFVRPGSPADRAGVESGDVILRFNGRPAESFNRLRNQIALTAPGEAAAMQVLRDGQRRVLTATLRNRDDATAEALGGANLESLGLIAADLDVERARQFRLRRVFPGAAILIVEPGGPADQAGLQSGDIIVSIDERAIDGVDQLSEALERSPGSARIEIVRGRVRGYVDIELR